MSGLFGVHGVPHAATELLYACALIWAAVPTPGFGADIRRLLTDSLLPGLSMAVVRDGEAVEPTAAGIRNASTGVPVDVHTVFEAASLSKPVFAYAVLQLVDAGQLSLDTPLSRYVPDYALDDRRAAEVTVRNVLSHTTGLPNWRNKEYSLKTYFPPGERFSYSGEGFVWLQRVVETISGEPLDAVLQRLVFGPLQMHESSYVWRPEFDANHAEPHGPARSPGVKSKPTAANSAYSLQTTAVDYARFLQAVLSGARLKPETARLWLEPQVRLRQHCSQCLSPDAPGFDEPVAWGLGWGLEPDGGTFFHWGDNGGFKAFVIGSVADRCAVVVFTNGANGMSIMADLIEQLMPGDHPAFKWLGYPRYTPRRR
jgi:CubicO group peptidase (beta-lactamase class C family)